MEKKKICITAECVCDLPEESLKMHGIDIIYFYIYTDSGRFRDVDDITANNIFEYINAGGIKTETKAPPIEDYVGFFTKKLESCDEIIHICISARISLGYSNAYVAVQQMGELGKQVHVIDSEHLSTGIGHIALYASQLLSQGADAETITNEILRMRKRVSTTFMTDNADYLYRNGKVSKFVRNICSVANIHPVLQMKNGELVLKSIQIGNYERSALSYIRRELRRNKHIDKKLLFITHAGCSISDIKLIRSEVERITDFEEIKITRASATISGNSGPRTFGVLYVGNERN